MVFPCTNWLTIAYLMHIFRWVCHWQAAFCLVSRYTHPTLAYTRCTVSMLSVWTWWLRARRGRWMWLPPLMVAEPSCQSPLWKLWWRACDIVLCMPSESAPAPQPWSLCQLKPVLASVTTVSRWCDAHKPLAPCHARASGCRACTWQKLS